jgi:hypothetical protein
VLPIYDPDADSDSQSKIKSKARVGGSMTSAGSAMRSATLEKHPENVQDLISISTPLGSVACFSRQSKRDIASGGNGRE